jgi:hypothetical protein
MLFLFFWFASFRPLIRCLSLDPLLIARLSAGLETGLVLHPRIISVAVYGLEVERSHLLEQVSLDDVADIVCSHNISVHVFLTL